MCFRKATGEEHGECPGGGPTAKGVGGGHLGGGEACSRQGQWQVGGGDEIQDIICGQ